MNTHEYVEYLLSNYSEIEILLAQLKIEKCNLELITAEDLIESLNFVKPSSDRIKSSEVTDKTAKIAMVYNQILVRLNNQCLKEIEKIITITENEIKRLNYCIERLEPVTKEVIIGLYKEKLSWKEISDKYDLSERSIGRHRNKGIEDLSKMFDLVNLKWKFNKEDIKKQLSE